MKRFLITTCVLCFFSSSVAIAESFPDVSENHENYKAIEYLKENGVIDGYEDGTFGPNILVNRAEAVKILVEGFGISYSGDFSEEFPDVNESDWFFEYVMAAKRDGILEGYQDGTFKPENTINLAEALKVVPMAGGISIPNNVSNDVFADVKSSDWFAKYALYSKNKNIVLADDEGMIYPSKDMTRADFAELIYRTMIVKENGGKEFPLHETWDYFQSGNLPFRVKYDDSWSVYDESNKVTFFKGNEDLYQFSGVRVYPDSGKVIVVLDNNSQRMTSEQYFANIKEAFVGANYTNFTLNEMPAFEVLYPELRRVDWYVYLEDGRVFAIYTEYGEGVLGFQLQQVIKSMLATWEYSVGEGTVIDNPEVNYENTGMTFSEKEELLSEIFENILIENQGNRIINSLGETIIIESDTIGVGTGVVDYYYSSELDYTLKYERASDLILDVREGRTSAF